MPAVQPIPKGYHSITPYLIVDDGAQALDFYKRAFGAQVKVRMDAPGGKLGHAELQIGDSMIMISDAMPGSGAKPPRALGGSPVSLMLYVNDVDATFKQAVSAGAKADAQPADMFWGDRYAKLTDPFGHQWSLATHKEDVSPEEMQKRTKEAMAKMGQKQGQPQPVG